MKLFTHCCLWTAFIAFCPLSGAGSKGHAQPSHRFDPDETLPKDFSKLLERQKKKGLLENIDNDLLRDLIKNMPKNIDPKDYDEATIKRLLDENPSLRDPKQIERFRDMIEQEKREPPNPNTPKVDWGHVEDSIKKVDEFRRNQKVDPKAPFDPNDPNMAKNPVNPTVPPQSPQPKQPRSQDKQSQDMARWLTKNFGDSPAMRNVVKDFSKMMDQGGKGNNAFRFLNQIEKEWKGFSGLGGKSDGQKSAAERLGNLASGVKLPDLNTSGSGNRPSAPSINSGSRNAGTGSYDSTSFSGPGSYGRADSWTTLLLVALLIAGGVFFWLRFIRNKPEMESEANASRRTWSVDPDSVTTRADVIRAFEHLSLSKCGEEAVNWHHRQIADQLGRKEPGGREAAEQLAGLYEKARYAPANELFSELEIAEARARLRQIAGAPTG